MSDDPAPPSGAGARDAEGAALPLRAGALSIGHRPRLKALKDLRAAGVTHVVTVLSESEQAQAIGNAATAAGLGWAWIEIGSTRVMPDPADPRLHEALGELVAILDAGGSIYLHCSAGIHRTGMIAAALLFRLGLGEADVRDALARLRAVTAENVGEQRLAWARSFAAD